jgi:23S rRNA pseudouridine1911/1915/1917 synthase
LTPARLVAAHADEGKRLDRLVSDAFPEVSRSLVQQLIETGKVHIVGRASKSSEKVRPGDVVEVELAPPPSLEAHPEPVPLNVVYEDAAMVVIDKPPGLVVHPAAGHASGTLVNGLLYRYPSLGIDGDVRPGLVHRLDKDTSGLLVVALTPSAQQMLSRQIATRRMKRRYQALVWGRLEPSKALIDVPIGRDPILRRKMAAGHGSLHSRDARTHYDVIEYLDPYTYVNVGLETGRTHQIRVHMAYIGHPVVGDPTYSSHSVAGLDRQFLHAYELELDSPGTGLPMKFSSELPSDLAHVLSTARSRIRS